MDLYAVGPLVLEDARDIYPSVSRETLPAADRLARRAAGLGWSVRVTLSVAAVPGVRRKREGMSGPGSMGYVTVEREIVAVRGRLADGCAWYQTWERDLEAGGWGTCGGSVRDRLGYRTMTVKALERYLSGEG